MALDTAFLSPRRLAAGLVEGIDGPLFTLALALSALGLVTLYSASYEIPARLRNRRRRAKFAELARRAGRRVYGLLPWTKPSASLAHSP